MYSFFYFWHEVCINVRNRKIMKKEVRDGKVAVLVSPGFGAGWYTEHGIEELIFHPKIVELVEQDNRHEITEELCKKLLNTDKYICTFGASNLKIFWINIGDKFIIEEYDGWEDIKTVDNLTLTA